jgi:hypothetical protein
MSTELLLGIGIGWALANLAWFLASIAVLP